MYKATFPTKFLANHYMYNVNTFRMGQQRTFLANYATFRKKVFRVKPKPPEPVPPRINSFNIQLLSAPLYQHVFKNVHPFVNSESHIEDCREVLKKHGMLKEDSFNVAPDVDLKLPPLSGKNLIEHFNNIGEAQVKPYRESLDLLLKSCPHMPKEWIMEAGWTRYAPGCNPEPVEFPLEDGLIFDIEVCLQAGQTPTLATAVSDKAWYGWVSQTVLDKTSKPVTNNFYTQDNLIPLESSTTDSGLDLNSFQTRPKVVIGHNVSYDRARIKEQYWLNQTATRFLDTMSMHICVSGLTSFQRAILKSDSALDEDAYWKSCSSLNSLSDVHKLYCGEHIEKETRNLFVEGTLGEINKQFQTVMEYCAKDVQATYNVLRKLFPLFLERFPHPVTLSGMLELSTAYLPVNTNWERYIDDSEQTYEDLDIEARVILAQHADASCQLLHGKKYLEDIWMWDQDWSLQDIKLRKNKKSKKQIEMEENQREDQNKMVAKHGEDEREDEEMDQLEKKFGYLEKTRELLPAVKKLLPGYPVWYRKLCTKPGSTQDWVPGPHLISTGMKVSNF